MFYSGFLDPTEVRLLLKALEESPILEKAFDVSVSFQSRKPCRRQFHLQNVFWGDSFILFVCTFNDFGLFR